jgi:uncharacterized protein YqeY
MIKNDLELSLKESMKSGDTTRRDILRVVLTNIKLAEVEKGAALDDAAVISLLQKEIKTHKESIEDSKKANRADLVEHYSAEMKILQEYLPEQMSEEDLRKIVKSAISETGATSASDMGKVMKVALPKVEGKAGNSDVSRIVREMLS